MQIKETAKQGLKREYSVVVPAADVTLQTETQLKEIGKTVKISGFRPGHVPVSILKQRYGKSILGEVLEKTVSEASRKVVVENKLRPAVQPDIKIKSFAEGKDLEFDMTVEVFPELPEIDLTKIAVTKPVFDISEKDQQEALERLAERNKTHAPKKDGTKAEKGDVVKIDFKGLRDGVAFEGGSAEGFSLELGSGQFIPGFEEQLIGVKKGDATEVKVTFPEAYHNADLAGQPAVFEVTVHDVLVGETPAVDDEFAKTLGFEGLDALKTSLKEHLSKDYDQYARNRMKKELFDALEDVCEFDIPPSMLEAEFQAIWQKLKQAQKEGDPSVVGRDDADLEAEYRGIAERRVRLGVYLAELGRASKVEVTQQELMKAVVEQARMFPGQEAKVVEFYQKNPSRIEELRGPIFEEKVVDFILGQVKLTEKQVSLEELVNLDSEDEEKDAAKAKKPAAKKAAKAKAEEETVGEDAPAKKAPAKKAAAKKTAEAK